VNYKCVKFHKNPISSLGGVALTRYMDGWGDSYIPPQTLFAGGIKTESVVFSAILWRERLFFNEIM
jgi:hypothetical protein